MKIVRVMKWIPVLFLIPALLCGCGDSAGTIVAENGAETETETGGTESEAETAFEIESSDGTESDIISWYTADINDDGKEELLLITRDAADTDMTLDTGEPYGRYVDIYSAYDILNNVPVPEGEPDYRFDLSEIKPLYIQAGDIDGNGTAEIAVCVYKTAEFHPVPARRPFFYALQNGQLEPVWLGSRLSRPFADYILSDVDRDGIAEIITIEYTERAHNVLTVYDWKGFGFEVKAQTDEFEDTVTFLSHINSSSDTVSVEIDGEKHQMVLDEEEVIRCIKE